MHHFKQLNFLVDEYATPVAPLDPSTPCSLSANLTAFYYLKDNLNDSSPNLLHLTSVPGTGTVVHNDGTDGTGPNTNNGYVEITGEAYLKHDTINTSLADHTTIDFWVYFDNVDPEITQNPRPESDRTADYSKGGLTSQDGLAPHNFSQTLVSFFKSTGLGHGCLAIDDTNHNLVWFNYNEAIHFPKARLTSNKWHHVILDFNPKGLSVALDGKIQKETVPLMYRQVSDKAYTAKLIDHANYTGGMTIGALRRYDASGTVTHRYIRNTFRLSRLRIQTLTDYNDEENLGGCTKIERFGIRNDAIPSDYDNQVLFEDEASLFLKLEGTDGRPYETDLVSGNRFAIEATTTSERHRHTYASTGLGLLFESEYYAYSNYTNNDEEVAYQFSCLERLSTIEFWYKGALSADAVIFTLRYAAQSGSLGNVAVLSDGRITLQTATHKLVSTNTVVGTGAGSPGASKNYWNHVVLTGDDTTNIQCTINDGTATNMTYIGGAGANPGKIYLVDTNTSHSISIGKGDYITAAGTLTSGSCEGSICNLALYSEGKQLTGTRVTAHYDAFVDESDYVNDSNAYANEALFDTSYTPAATTTATNTYYHSGKAVDSDSGVNWARTVNSYSRGKRYFEFNVYSSSYVYLSIGPDRFNDALFEANFGTSDYATTNYTNNGYHPQRMPIHKSGGGYERFDNVSDVNEIFKSYPISIEIAARTHITVGVALDMIKRKVTFFLNGIYCRSVPVPLTNYYVYIYTGSAQTPAVVIPEKYQYYPNICTHQDDVVMLNEFNGLQYDRWGSSSDTTWDDVVALPNTFQDIIDRTNPAKYFKFDGDLTDSSTNPNYTHNNLTKIGTGSYSFESVPLTTEATNQSVSLDGSVGFDMDAIWSGDTLVDTELTVMVWCMNKSTVNLQDLYTMDFDTNRYNYLDAPNSTQDYVEPRYGSKFHPHYSTNCFFHRWKGIRYSYDCYNSETLLTSFETNSSLSGTASSTNTICSNSSGIKGLNGNVSHVAVWDRPLSYYEMDELYLHGRPYFTYESYSDYVHRSLAVSLLYKFDEDTAIAEDANSKAIAYCSSPMPYHLRYEDKSVASPPTFATSLLEQDTNGKCVYFNGTSDQIGPGASGHYATFSSYINEPGIATEGVSMSIWIKLDASVDLTNGHYPIICEGQNNASGGMELAVYKGKIGFYFTDTSDVLGNISIESSTVSHSTVYHITTWYRSYNLGSDPHVEMELYVDGALVGTGDSSTYTVSMTNPTFYALGATPSGASVAKAVKGDAQGTIDYFKGWMDEFAIFKNKLTSSHVSDLYGSRLINIDDSVNDNLGIFAHWKLEEASGSSAAIDSKNGWSLTATNVTFATTSAHGSSYDTQGASFGATSTLTTSSLPSTLPTGDFSILAVVDNTASKDILAIGGKITLSLTAGRELDVNSTYTSTTLASPLLDSIFIVVAYDSTNSNLDFYINGKKQTIGSATLNTTTGTNVLTIGSASIGLISDVTIYQNYLTETNIDELNLKFTNQGPYKSLPHSITVSNNNVSVTSTGATNIRIPAYYHNRGVETYAEIKINTKGAGVVSVGLVSNALINSNTTIGTNTGEIAVLSSGHTQDDGSSTSNGVTFTTGDTIGIYSDGSTVSFYKKPSNSDWINIDTSITPTTLSLSGFYYIVVSTINDGDDFNFNLDSVFLDRIVGSGSLWINDQPIAKVDTDCTTDMGPNYYYKMDETTGTVAIDSTTTASGTYTDVTLAQLSIHADVGYSVLFDQTTSKLTVGGISDKILGNKGFSTSFWVKIPSYDASDMIIFSKKSASKGISLFIDSGDILTFSVWVFDGGVGAATENTVTTTDYPKDTWFHVAATWEYTNMKLWVDGIQKGGTTTPSQNYIKHDDTVPLTIGGDGTNNSNGYINNFASWDQKILSSANITQIINYANGSCVSSGAVADAALPPNQFYTTLASLSPVEYWKLNEAAGTTAAAEITTPGLDGTYVGGPTLQQTTALIPPPASDYSVDFLVSDYVTVAHNASLMFTTNMSFVMLVKVAQADYATWDHLLSKAAWGASGYGFGSVANNTEIGFYVSAYNVANNRIVISSSLLFDDSWHLVVGTYDGGATELKIYIDGTLQGTQSSAPATIPSNTSPVMFPVIQSTSYQTPCQIECVALFNTTLTQANITSLWNETGL